MINGNESRALNALKGKIRWIAPLLNLMLALKVNQRQLSSLSGISYETVRKMFRTPSHGTEENFELLYNTLLDYENKLKEEFPEYGY